MDQPIINVQNISKKFVLSHQQLPYETLRDKMTELAKKPLEVLRGRKIKTTKEDFWALRDINFSVQRGEVIGIIGPNGSGKSTLLKILSQITPPTTGEITLRGRVASLLEVGTGFHPELTGRENIFLNGAILGIPKKEIVQKFDEIVAFSGVEKFLDTPVKRYSSGMYVRLAFSVAAHMEPDILIIDEVLAVGDAEFQKKCLEKMESITKKEGRTILFVSHNLVAVQNLCHKTIALEAGQIKHIGETAAVIDAYLKGRSTPSINPELHDRQSTSEVRFTDLKISARDGSEKIMSHSGLRFTVGYSSDLPEKIPNPRVYITVFSETSKQAVLRLDSAVPSKGLAEAIAPHGQIICETGPINLIEGNYTVNLDIEVNGENRDHLDRTGSFYVETDLATYDYQRAPDPNAADSVIRFEFSQ